MPLVYHVLIEKEESEPIDLQEEKKALDLICTDKTQFTSLLKEAVYRKRPDRHP